MGSSDAWPRSYLYYLRHRQLVVIICRLRFFSRPKRPSDMVMSSRRHGIFDCVNTFWLGTLSMEEWWSLPAKQFNLVSHCRRGSSILRWRRLYRPRINLITVLSLHVMRFQSPSGVWSLQDTDNSTCVLVTDGWSPIVNFLSLILDASLPRRSDGLWSLTGRDWTA